MKSFLKEGMCIANLRATGHQAGVGVCGQFSEHLLVRTSQNTLVTWTGSRAPVLASDFGTGYTGIYISPSVDTQEIVRS